MIPVTKKGEYHPRCMLMGDVIMIPRRSIADTMVLRDVMEKEVQCIS